MIEQRSSVRTDGFSWANSWGIPVGLIMLSVVPIIMGASRLEDVGNGIVIYAPYFPVVVHIVSVTIYCLLGAAQFSGRLRKSRPGWHRTAGYWVLPAGFITAVSGLWLSQFYPNTPFDGPWVYWSRLVGGMLMLAFLVSGLVALINKSFQRHGRYMMRAYAIGIGAGTQVLFLFFIMEVVGSAQDFALAVGVTAGWALNLAVVEFSIRSAYLQTE